MRRPARDCLRFVSVLRAVVLALDHNAGRQVRDTDCRIGLVDVLTTRSRGAIGVNAQVGGVDGDGAQLVGLGHDRDGTGRGVDPPLGLGRRYALHTMAAGLELEFGVGTIAFDAGNDLAKAAKNRYVLRNDLDFPALTFGVTRIHAEQVTGE